MLSGGVVRPWVRRRELRTTVMIAYMTTSTTRRIHPAAGVMVPLTRSSMTLLEIVITPPTAPLSLSKT